MSTFTNTYRIYQDLVKSSETLFDFNLEAVEKIEPYLSFLYKQWWRVDLTGKDFLPKHGPAFIVGNSGSILPWPGLMLLFALMNEKPYPRRLHIMADMDGIGDERLYTFLTELGFVDWSADNAKRLFAAGEVVATFPEGIAGLTKPYSDRYRLMDFDWTKFLPAAETKVPIYSLCTLGCEDSLPVFGNMPKVAQFLGLPEYPITPFFPWLPFPANLLSFPGKWQMRILKSHRFDFDQEHDDLEDLAKKQARHFDGEIQSELNRLLRKRAHEPFSLV